MKKASYLLAAATLLVACSVNAATFVSTNFTLSNPVTATATVGGITATLLAADTLGNAALVLNTGGTAFFAGVGGLSDQGTAPQSGRISPGQSLTLSFDQAVVINVLGFNNLNTVAGSTEVARINASGSALTGLTGYTDPNTTTQTDVAAEGLVWGYTSPTFNISLTTGNGNNVSQDILFGTGGTSSIFLAAGETLTFDATVSTNGGYGLNSFTVTAVPEPSTYGLMGAGALAAVAFVRRRRKVAGKIA